VKSYRARKKNIRSATPLSSLQRLKIFRPISCTMCRLSSGKLGSCRTAAYHERIQRDQPIQSRPARGPEAFIQTALEATPASATSKKAWAWMALTGRRPAEIFFSASFSLPREKLPYPALPFDGQLKTRQSPGTSSEPYLIPVPADPKKLVQALDTLRAVKSFPSTKAVNTTTGRNSPNTFPPPSAPSTSIGNPAT
jgi:Telomere resolvase